MKLIKNYLKKKFTNALINKLELVKNKKGRDKEIFKDNY